MQELISLDHELFKYLNNLGQSNWDAFWLVVTNKLTWIPLYIGLIVYLCRVYKWQQVLYVLILTALLIVAADQLANVFKNGFERFRPCHTPSLQGNFRPVDCEGRGRYGFYSAHAANHMALAFFIGSILKNKIKILLPILVIWALLIGYSRIYVGVHFPGDVLVGFFIGLLLGVIFYKIYLYFLPKVMKSTN